ncbi:hypothetical protein GR294_01155 [Raoultella sp. Lac2]|nr:hypothetical protein [Raoultella sp. Lac2]MXF97391.1 hypothetical protein [Raoultella sp. Lac1]
MRSRAGLTYSCDRQQHLLTLHIDLTRNNHVKASVFSQFFTLFQPG